MAADVPGAWVCNVFHSQRGSNENLEQCNATPAEGSAPVPHGGHTRRTATRVPDHAREYRKELPPFFVGITGRFWRSLGGRSSIRGHRTILIDITA